MDALPRLIYKKNKISENLKYLYKKVKKQTLISSSSQVKETLDLQKIISVMNLAIMIKPHNILALFSTTSKSELISSAVLLSRAYTFSPNIKVDCFNGKFGQT